MPRLRKIKPRENDLLEFSRRETLLKCAKVLRETHAEIAKSSHKIKDPLLFVAGIFEQNAQAITLSSEPVVKETNL